MAPTGPMSFEQGFCKEPGAAHRIRNCSRCYITGVCAKDPSIASVPDATGTSDVPVLTKVDGKGSKISLDGSKLRLDLVPPQTVEAIADILGFGAKKYAAHNWMKGIAWSQIAAGIKRHLSAFEKGEEIDPESGRPHLAHALCGLTFLHYYAHGPKREQYVALGLDDRVFREAADPLQETP